MSHIDIEVLTVIGDPVRRTLAALWPLTGACALHLDRAGAQHAGWFYLWQTGSAQIGYRQLALEDVALALVGIAALILTPKRPIARPHSPR